MLLNKLSNNSLIQKIQPQLKINLQLQPQHQIKGLKVSKSEYQKPIALFLFQLNFYNFSNVALRKILEKYLFQQERCKNKK